MKDTQSKRNDENAYTNIGGWLILFAIGLVLYPVQTMVSLVTELIPAVAPQNWSALTSSASPGYHSFWAPLVIVELVGNVCFLIYAICLVVFFFQRRKYVPKLTILFLIANLIFVGLDYFLMHFIIFRASSLDMDAIINLVRSVVACIVWVPYFVFSRRVRRTFVNPKVE
jgi:hypothetical protein